MMRQVFVLMAALFAVQTAFAQNTFKAAVKNEEGQRPVAGATVSLQKTGVSAKTDADGKVSEIHVGTMPVLGYVEACS